MSGEQMYNSPVAGINRMMEDIKNFFSPTIFELHPLLKVMSIINLGLVIVVFAGLLFYMVYVRHHHIMDKLRRPTNYFAAGILLFIYVFVSETPLIIGPELDLNLGLVVMPLAAKLFGPVIAGAFGILQYGASFIMHPGEEFNLSFMLVAGISGMLYGWIIYARKTNYIRCLWAKLVVNVVCNIILVPMVQGDIFTTEMADSITCNIASNILLVPVQALMIFVALLIMKAIRRKLSEVSWGLGR